jgi:hypothetical protein
MGLSGNDPVISSEAKQSRSRNPALDCFVASLLAMTAARKNIAL